MKVSELKLLIDDLYEHIKNGEELDMEIVIPNDKPSYGKTSHTKVKSLSCGFDWDKGLLFIIPSNKMIEK